MPLDETQIKDLRNQLRHESESVRLKACDVLAKLPASDRASVKSTIGALTEVFLDDPNPAVKFMAKKALQNLGESPDKIKQSAEAAKGGSSVQEVDRTALAREIPILWKCSQETLRPCVQLLPRLIWSPDDKVRMQLSGTLEKSGLMLAAGPLILAFQEEKKSPDWEAREASESNQFTDIRDVIDLMSAQASGVNPALAAAMGNLQRPEVLAEFIDMLRSSNEVLRNNAVQILAELKDARTIDPLLQLLGTGQLELDSKVITTLSKVARADKDLQIQILKKILSHFRPSEPEAKLFCIVEAVGRIANPKTLDFIKGCLRHSLARVRANAVEALQNFNVTPEERVKLLVPLLRDDNNRVLGNTVVALWGTMVHSHVQAEVEVMARHPDKWVRASLAYSMGVINAPGVVPYLLRLLEDREPDVRRNAAKSIRKLSNSEAISTLGGQIQNPNLNVRIYCIDTIGRYGLSEHTEKLKQIVSGQGVDVRLLSAAILALGRMKDPSALELISRYLKHEEDRVRANAVEALEAMNEPKVVPLVQASITDSNPRTRANAAKALWKYGDVWVVDAVKSMLENPDVRMLASGAYCLGEMADMTRTASRLVTLPLLMQALRRHPKFNDFKTLLG